MPINVIGNSNQNNASEIDTSQFVQKPYLKSNYIEENINHDIDLKNQYRILNIPNPIDDKDIVSKIYIDTKIVDIIRRNIQNNDYISFLDNDNVEYKLIKYTPKITLTNVSLFITASGTDCNSAWACYTQTGNIINIISGLSTITPLSWRTGPGSLYQELSYISFQSYFLSTNTYAEMSRFDIYNFIKIELIINRYSQDNIMGESTILYKNSNDEWIEAYKLSENTDITPRNEWDIITIPISEKNYGIKLRHSKKNSVNQMFSISKIVLTYTI